MQLVSLLRSCALVLTLTACGQPTLSTPKVVGGARDLRSFPGSLKMLAYDSHGRNSGLCTGAFIRDDVFMTAGHCMREFPVSSISVSADSGYFRDHPARSSRLVVHPEFSMSDDYFNELKSDIAFAYFPRGTAPSNLVVPVAPATPDVGDTVYIVGWGRTDLHNPNSAFTRNVGSNTVNAIWDHWGHAIVLYRAGKTHGTDDAATGNGDSGGPLYDDQGRALGIVHGGGDYEDGIISQYTNLNDPQIARFMRDALAGK